MMEVSFERKEVSVVPFGLANLFLRDWCCYDNPS